MTPVKTMVLENQGVTLVLTNNKRVHAHCHWVQYRHPWALLAANDAVLNRFKPNQFGLQN